MEQFTDYYTVLGVETNAPASVIKTKFKQLALQYHPDVYKGEDAQERMRVLLLAYQTLNNPETRKTYDEQHAHHFMGVPAPHNRTYVNSTVISPNGTLRKSTEVSPTARRDRQRHYAFPDLNSELQSGQTAHITLGDISYDLSSDETRVLAQAGLLRGVEVTSKGKENICHRCHHHWSPVPNKNGAVTQERLCPSCHALDWPEYLLLRCSHCHAVFESEQIRYEVGSYHYGDGDLCPPYELFPLCPYCSAAGWCPAENIRVGALRKQAERRAAILRLVWLTVAIVAIIVLSAITINLVR